MSWLLSDKCICVLNVKKRNDNIPDRTNQTLPEESSCLGFQKGSWELQCANSSKLILRLKQVVPTDDWLNCNAAVSAGCQ